MDVMTSMTSMTSVTFLMYCLDPKDHILKVLWHYLHFWLKYKHLKHPWHPWHPRHPWHPWHSWCTVQTPRIISWKFRVNILIIGRDIVPNRSAQKWGEGGEGGSAGRIVGRTLIIFILKLCGLSASNIFFWLPFSKVSIVFEVPPIGFLTKSSYF